MRGLLVMLVALATLGPSGPPRAAPREAPATNPNPNPASTPPDASAPSSPPPARRGVLTRAPVLKTFVEAEYPPDALAAGITGSVLLSIVIDADGSVSRAVVEDPGPHPGFAAAALHAVAQFEFEPAEIDGTPASVEISYRYEFVIRQQAVPAPAEAPVVLHGRVIDRATRRPVAGAWVQAGTASALTDAEGRFELRGLGPGEVSVRVTSPAHERLVLAETIEPGKKKEIEYRLSPRRDDPYEALVRGERERREIAVRTLELEEVRSLPGTQGDTLKVLQNLPGVARVPFGLGLLVVRGSAPSDTRFYMDGIEVPLLFHFGGITSVVNSEVLSTLEFFPGNFSARYGRGAGGVVDVKTRDGKPEVHGDLQLDVFDGKLLLEGPIGRGSVYGSVRRSWVDGVLALALPRIAPDTADDLRVAPRYYDYQLKLAHPAPGGRLTLSVYGADDAMKFVDEDDSIERPTFGLSTMFHRVALRHTAAAGDFTHDITAAWGYDKLDVIQSDNFGALTILQSLSLRDALTWRPRPDFTLELGVDAQLRTFRYELSAPPLRPPEQVGGIIEENAIPLGEDARGTWLSPAAYIEASWKPTRRLRLVPGLRVDYDSRLRRESVWVDPRLSVFFDLRPGTTLAAAVGSYGAPPQPQDMVELFGNPDLVAEKSLQYSVGLRQVLPWSSRLELTGFFKQLDDLVVRTAATDEDGELLQRSNGGIGEAYGIEALLRRELTRGVYGWIAYTWSVSSRRDDPTISTFPEWHLFGFDQTHILTAVVSWRLPRGWIVGGRLRGASGNPYTPPVGAVYLTDSGRYQCLLADQPNSARQSAFFQADARVDKRFAFKRWAFSAYLDVQNVTNRQNAEFRFFNFDCSQQVEAPGLPFFPTFGLRAQW